MNSNIVEFPYRTKQPCIPFSKDHVVYFLLQGDYVAYVGQTTHLAARVAQHVVDGKQFDYVSFISVSRKEALYIEAINIQYHNPCLNQLVPTNKEIAKIRSRLNIPG